jgi:hypothetical protein
MKAHKFRACGVLRPLLSGPKIIKLLVDDRTSNASAANAQDATAVCVPHHGTRRDDPLWRVDTVFATYAEADVAFQKMPPTGRAIFRLQNDRDMLAVLIGEQHARRYVDAISPRVFRSLTEEQVLQRCLDAATADAKVAPAVALVFA